MRRRPLDTPLALLARGILEVAHQLSEAGTKTRTAAGNFFAQVLTPEEREAFSMARYSASVWEPEADSGLRKWEEAWFQDMLPKAPARLLVAACGTGREVAALTKQGYQIDAFDGAPRALEVARRVCPNHTRLFEATYRDLADAVFTGKETPLTPLAHASYDAIVLGWGSLTHVAGRSERLRVLRACAALTDGPILCSFYAAPRGEQEKSNGDRWVRLGRWCGKSLGRSEGPAFVELSHWGGFAEFLTKEELALHGAALGRKVEWDEGNSASFPHVTLLRPVQ